MKNYITEKEFRNRPYISVLKPESDGDFHYEYFVLSTTEEPIYYEKNQILNVLGSYIDERTDNKCILYHPKLNYSENYYGLYSLQFVDKDFSLSFNDHAADAKEKFIEFAVKVVAHMNKRITLYALEALP